MNPTNHQLPANDLSGWSVTSSREGNRLELAFSGELDLHTATNVDVEAIVPDEDIREVSINLSAVTFIDSTGVGLVLRLSQRARELGADPQIMSWPQHVGLFGDAPLAPLWRALGIDDEK
jgi:anti-anti-sigma factor